MTTPTPTPTVVSIEHWTRRDGTAFDGDDRYTVVYTDPQTQKVWRCATRATEAEARDFAEAHGWTVGRVSREEAAS